MILDEGFLPEQWIHFEDRIILLSVLEIIPK